MKLLKAAKYNFLVDNHNLSIICLQLSFFIAWLFYVKSLTIHAIKYNLSSNILSSDIYHF